MIPLDVLIILAIAVIVPYCVELTFGSRFGLGYVIAIPSIGLGALMFGFSMVENDPKLYEEAITATGVVILLGMFLPFYKLKRVIDRERPQENKPAVKKVRAFSASHFPEGGRGAENQSGSS